MLSLIDYQISEKLHESSNSIIYKANKKNSKMSFIIKRINFFKYHFSH